MTLTSAEHFLMEGAAPWPLRDELTLPNGRHLRGNRARVYDLLKGAAERGECFRIGSRIGPAGWVPNYYLGKAWSGGDEGKKRVRELRYEFGVGIEVVRFAVEGEETSTWLYRWTSDPDPGLAPEANQPTETAARNPSPPTVGIDARVLTGRPEGSARRTNSRPQIAATPDRLSFFTCVGNPGAGAPGPVNLAPHFRHLLAPATAILAGSVRGELAPDQAAARYREQLAAAYADGELRFFLDEHAGKVVTFWLAPEAAAAFDPFPTLVHALTRCEAIHLGDWQQRGAA